MNSQRLNEVEMPIEEEPKDRTRWLWLGVAVVFLACVIALWVANQKTADNTRVRVKHILIKFNSGDPVDRSRALETIKAVQAQLDAGASFSRLAKDYSNDEGSSARGGDLGYNDRGVFDGAFESYVWSAPIGQVSDIVQTKFGFHLIVVTDRHVSKADQYEMDLEKKATEIAPGASVPAGTAPEK